MLTTIRRFFEENLARDEGDGPDDHAVRLAAAALLIEVGRADYNLHGDELGAVRDLVASQFGLTDEEANTLVQLAEEQADTSVGLHGFTSLINAEWTETERVNLVEQMWRIAYADGRLDKHELHLMRKVQRLLYISHRPFIESKLKARDEAAGGG